MYSPDALKQLDKEIRLKCLDFALSNKGLTQSPLELAQTYYEFVVQNEFVNKPEVNEVITPV